MPCLPGYRYCGPGCRGPGSPTNPLDYYCMEHDYCYQRGAFRRMCDDTFLQNLYPYLHRRDKLGRDARLMHRVIRFKLML